jgi:hypothetical protein
MHDYFDTETFSRPPKWFGYTDWVHCGALGGHKGIFETLKGDDGLPLVHSPFIRHNTYSAGNMGTVRNSGNLALIKGWDRPELSDFINDYHNSVQRIIPDFERTVVTYFADQMVAHLI